MASSPRRIPYEPNWDATEEAERLLYPGVPYHKMTSAQRHAVTMFAKALIKQRLGATIP